MTRGATSVRRRGTKQDEAGISNRPVARERGKQAEVPPRGQAKQSARRQRRPGTSRGRARH